MLHLKYKKRTTLLAVLLFLAATSLLWFVQTGRAADPCAIPNFTGPTNLSVTAPRAIVVDDFNEDGNPDIASAANRIGGTISILLGNGSGGFSAPTSFSAGRQATFLASGDLNGDSNSDLVIANQSNTEGELSILFGNGTGGFGSEEQIFLIGGSPNSTTSVAIGEVTGDGKADLILTSATFSSVMVLQGDGAGGFTFLINLPSGGFSPSQVVLADLNGDNKIDLVVSNQFVANQDFGNVAIFLGDGAGHFSAPTSFTLGVRPNSIAVGDFNGDTKRDLAVVNNGSNTFSVLLGDGAGSFDPVTTHDAKGVTPLSVLQGDFNGDSKTDLTIFNARPGNAVVFLGDGAGAFTPVANFSGVESFESLPTAELAAVGDFNRDGRPDLAKAQESLGSVLVFLNTCGAAVGSQLQFNRNQFSGMESDEPLLRNAIVTVTRVGDITGTASVNHATSNGTAIAPQDYIAVAETVNFAPGETFKTVGIPLINDNINEGIESFNETLSNVGGNASLGSPSSASVVIIDNDPAPTISVNDATVVEGNSGTTNLIFTVNLSHLSAFTVMVNHATADGTATAGNDYQSSSGTLTFNPGQASKQITVVINGDTVPEITETLFINLSSPVNASLGDVQGVGTIAEEDMACPIPSFDPATNVSTGSGPFSLVTDDFTNDGKTDLASANIFSNNVTILPGDGLGGFGTPVNIGVGNGPRSIAKGDFNTDGKLDLITANFPASGGSSGISVLLADNAGGFAPPINTSPVAGSVAIAVGDLNVDNKPDIVVASITANTLSVLLGNGAGAFGMPTAFGVGTNPVSVALADFNNDTKLDAVVSNQNSSNVSVLLGNGDGTFAAAVSLPAGQNPQASAVGDFNSDGKNDLAVANATSKDLSILIGDGNGGFAATSGVSVADSVRSVITTDLNGDGRLDLVVPNTDNQFANGSLAVYFGNGAGAFSPGTTYTVGASPISAAAGDFNSDTKPDLAVSNIQSNNVSVLLNTCGAMPKLLLSTASKTVTEGSGPTIIAVTRSGEVRTAVTVDYATSDTSGLNNCSVVSGAASSRCDYTRSIGTLHFDVGETSKNILVLITDDAYAEGSEVLTVSLSGPGGGNLGSPSMATVTIEDNEGVNGPNSIDQPAIFVRQHYHDFLNREPDPGGLAFWTNEITSCGNDTLCIEIKRINVSAAFFLSIEFQETGYLVCRIYKAAYGDTTSPNVAIPVPIIRLNEFLPDAQRIGQGVQVGIGDWQAKLEANKNGYAREFVARQRFLTDYPLTMTPAQFVDKLNLNAGDVLSQTEREQLIAALSIPGDVMGARAFVLRKVAEDADLRERETTRAFVLMQYYGYMRRNPDDPQDTDFRGWEFWLNKLNQFNGNFVQAEMVKAFITSIEYRQRFGP